VAPAHPARGLRHGHAQVGSRESALVPARPQGRRRPARGRGHEDRRAAGGLPDPATGKPWQDVQGAVERARTKAGLDGVWVHDLRRSFVTLSRRSGLPESVVARFSGHRTAAVFKRYNIVEEQDLKAAVQVLNRTRKAAGSGQEASGRKMDAVDEK
jgi:hypothetical protein